VLLSVEELKLKSFSFLTFLIIIHSSSSPVFGSITTEGLPGFLQFISPASASNP